MPLGCLLWISPCLQYQSSFVCSVTSHCIVAVCSRDFETVLMACLDDGFRWLTDQIAEYLKPCTSSGMTPV